MNTCNHKPKKIDISSPDFKVHEQLCSTDDLDSIRQKPVLDLELALKIMGSKELMQEILPLMLSPFVDADILALKKAYQVKDWAKMGQLAHKIKGGAVSCGATRLYFASLYMEKYVKTGQKELLDALFHMLINTLDLTQKAIRRWFSHQQ